MSKRKTTHAKDGKPNDSNFREKRRDRTLQLFNWKNNSESAYEQRNSSKEII